MPTSTVWFWNLRASRKAPFEQRMHRLLKAAGAAQHVRPGDLLALKMHFGEAGVTAFITPIHVRPIVDFFRKAGAKPFLTDTNTLYAGQRGEAVSHKLQAAQHGFDPNILGAPVIIADGLRSTNEAAVTFKGKHISTAYLAGDIVNADLLVTLSHFKGHELAGFGGALKNVAMGCATRRGKMQQHGCLAPQVRPDNCKGCGICVEVCAPGALRMDEDKRISVDKDLCAGCGACFHACAHHGVEIDWNTDINEFLGRMMEYAAATLLTRSKPTLHVSFVMGVTPNCDCVGYSDAPVCPDIGVLASWDPVALDQACLDLVTAAPPLYPSSLPAGLRPGQDKLHALTPSLPPDMGLAYAESLGLGSRAYEIKAV
jgi:uncharacterized Fe-S center protein